MIEPYRGEPEQFDPYWLERMYSEWEENEQYLEDDMDEYPSYDEGGYCEYGDHSFYEDEVAVPLDQWTERYACPICGHVDERVYKSDYYYDLGLYLLSVADDDFVWPEYWTPLPKYEA